MKRPIENIKNSGFKLPEGYLDSLEDNILSKAKFSKVTNSGFKMPNGYLDSLEDKIINTVSKNENVKVIKLFSKQNIIYISSIAAAILLLFNLSLFKQKPSFDSLEMATIESYILNEDIDMDQIASLLTQEELAEENFIDNSFSEENIETYILNNVDIEDYISE